MKLAILLVSLFIGAFLVQDTAAWGYWGWGGLGWGGYGLGGYGWGGLYSPYYTLGYRYFRDTMSRGNLSQRADCSYVADKSVFVCQGEKLGVECEVVANLTNYVPTKNFELFGIGNLWRVNTTTPVSLTRFNLYPRLLDNSAWLNHTTFVEGHEVNLNLFHSTTYNDRFFGFRIVDVNCYQKLVEIFNHVPVTSYENVTITGENGVTHTVPLFGQVLVRKIAV